MTPDPLGRKTTFEEGHFANVAVSLRRSTLPTIDTMADLKGGLHSEVQSVLYSEVPLYSVIQ